MIDKVRDPEDIKTTLDDRDNVELFIIKDEEE